MIKSYKEQKAFDFQVRAFLETFFTSLQQDSVKIFEHLEPNNYPGGFDYNAKGLDNVQFGKYSLFETDTGLIIIHKHPTADMYCGYRIIATRKVSLEWIEALRNLVAYTAVIKPHGFKEMLVTYQKVGYTVTNISETKLKTEYPEFYQQVLEQ